MATTRTAYDAVAGTTLTAANLDKHPGGWVGEASATADQTGLSAITDLTNLSITFTAVAARRYRISAKVEVQATVADGEYELHLTDGSGTQLARAVTQCVSTTFLSTLVIFFQEVPGGGSITRKLRLGKLTGTGTVSLRAAANRAAILLIEDIGPSS